MHIFTYHHLSLLYVDAANHFVDAIQNKPDAVLGLATGSTPIEIYKHLVKAVFLDHLNINQIKTFNLDEYVGLSIENPQSYAYFMKKHLFDFLNMKCDQIHIPSGMATDLNAECKRYEALLNEYPIDIQLLGLGSNGHIAFNEPGTSFDSLTHVVKLDEKTKKDNARFFDSIDLVPDFAITMGIQTVLKAKKIVLVATGLNKAKAVKRMIEGPISEDCPASILQKHPEVYIFLDDKAASLLENKA